MGIMEFTNSGLQSKVKMVAVVGCGKRRDGKEGWAIGHCHAEAYLAVNRDIQLLGVDIDPANLKAFGEVFSVPAERLFLSTQEMYASVIPDCVSICTWPQLHAPQVIEAANSGVKGIYCEKPLALNPGEIREMRAACEKNGVRFAVAHQRRMEPVFMRFKEIVLSGEIGGEVVVEGRVGDGWDILSWTTHLFDLANFIFDSFPVSVLAGMDHSGAHRYGHAVENHSVVLAEYPEHRQAIFVTGPEALGGALLQARGKKGMVSLEGSTLRIFKEAGFREEFVPQNEPFMTPPLRALIAAVETGSDQECDVAKCAAATELAYAAHESARTIRKIDFPAALEYAPLDLLQRTPKAWLPEGDLVLYSDGHFGSGGREGISDALFEASGRQPVVIDAETTPLNSQVLKNASLLLIYHTQNEPDASTVDALTEWVKSGKPLAIIHAGLGAYPKWQQYREWCGRVWSWGDTAPPSEHPYESCQIQIRGSLPVAWREGWIPKDEVFIKLVEVSACNNLAMAKISSGEHPAAWTNCSFPSVGVFVPGHRRDMWSVPALREAFIALLQQISLA